MAARLALAAAYLVILQALGAAPAALPITDPQRDYVSSGQYPEGMQPTGDEILRLDLDLDRTGNPTVFLAYKSFGSRSGHTWTAYQPTANGEYLRIDSTADGEHLIQFRPDAFFAGAVPDLAVEPALFALYPGREGANLVRYDFRDGVARFTLVRELDYRVAADRDLFRSLFNRAPEEPPRPADGGPSVRVLSAASIRADGRVADRVTSESLSADTTSRAPLASQQSAPRDPTSRADDQSATSTTGTHERSSGIARQWSWVFALAVLLTGLSAIAIARRRT